MTKVEYIDCFNTNPLIVVVKILEGDLSEGDYLPRYGTIDAIEQNHRPVCYATSEDGKIGLHFERDEVVPDMLPEILEWKKMSAARNEEEKKHVPKLPTPVSFAKNDLFEYSKKSQMKQLVDALQNLQRNYDSLNIQNDSLRNELHIARSLLETRQILADL